MRDDALDVWLQTHDLRRITDRTITSARRLKRNLQASRERGDSVTRGENVADVMHPCRRVRWCSASQSPARCIELKRAARLANVTCAREAVWWLGTTSESNAAAPPCALRSTDPRAQPAVACRAGADARGVRRRADDSALACAVLTGAGDRYFAGGDSRDLAEVRAEADADQQGHCLTIAGPRESDAHTAC